MKIRPKLLNGLMLSLAILPSLLIAEGDQTVARLLTEGKTSINLRYRFEEANQDNSLRDASASTLRTRLAYQTPEISNMAFLLEVDNVMTLGADRFDSFQLDRNRGRYSVIADPEGTEINQALLRYTPGENSVYTLGRQRINHGTQRFLGGVGWRQNEQTFDAFSYHYSKEKITVDYSYLWRVNRIFNGSRSSSQLTDFDSNSHALLASYAHTLGTFSVFVYALDFDNAATASSLSTGISYKGKTGPVSLYAAYASQSDLADNRQNYQADYYLVEGSLSLGKIILSAGFEQLGSDNGNKGFSTPLATLHKFQGFTDLFLNTPDQGVEDSYLNLTGSIDKLQLSVAYHQLQADETGDDYGSEWQFHAVYPFSRRLGFELKYANYQADGFAVDTEKIWLSLNMAF
ncbi:MAG: porin [Pseudomonadales bacterium]|nr:porin [Pseudomonadales bacterium]